MAAALFAASGCAFEVTEKAFLFPREQSTPNAMLTPCERSNVEIPVGQDVVVRGWVLRAPENDRWLLLFYGNSGSVTRTLEQQDALARLFHANVVVLDYRGYGFSDGHPSIHDIAEDGLVIFDYVHEHLAQGEPILVAAHSLGTLPALFIASQRPVAGTVLMGTVTSAQDALDMLVRTIPWWQRMWISVHLAPALRELKPTTDEMFEQIREPLLVVHDTHDELFPIEHVRRLFALAPSKQKTFCAIDQGTHQNSVPSSASTHLCLEQFSASLPRGRAAPSTR